MPKFLNRFPGETLGRSVPFWLKKQFILPAKYLMKNHLPVQAQFSAGSVDRRRTAGDAYPA
jgi:hypothetical protein